MTGVIEWENNVSQLEGKFRYNSLDAVNNTVHFF